LNKKIKLKNSKIEVLNGIDEHVVNLYSDYLNDTENYIKRSKEWLEWRYLKSLRGKHHLIGVKENDKLTALVILKEDVMFDNEALVVMDYAYIPGKENSFLYLLQAIELDKTLISFDYNLIMFSGLSSIFNTLTRIGYYKVPDKLNPKEVKFMVRKTSDIDLDLITDASKWRITMGDWDIF